MFRSILAILIVLTVAASAFGQAGRPVVPVHDDSIKTGINYWYSDTVYNLKEFVFVEDGEVLIIEPGTVVKGDPGLSSDASALIVARGGRLYAEGTPTQPIIFTSILDDVDNPYDIPLDTAFGVGRGLWGGVILLGRAYINAAGCEFAIEGIPPEETRGLYGGSDDDDNSGVLKHVSIRHGGSEIGAANEINGLTMGGVGRGTVISHVEVFYNYDDGFEWFGGSVNCDHLVAAFCGDDAFDYDEGWRGGGQFWFAIEREDSGDRCGEHDGGNNPVDGFPWATPLISNATYFGRGAVNGGQRCFEIRDNASTAYYNSIFTDHGTYGIKVEYNATEDPATSRQRLQEGMTKFYNNIWYGFGNGNTAADICNNVAETQQYLFDNGWNIIGDPVIAAIDRAPNGLLNPRPTDLAGAGWTGWTHPRDAVNGYYPENIHGNGFSGCGADTLSVNYPDYEVVDYAGAFDPNSSSIWICNWTALDSYGFLADDCSAQRCECATDGLLVPKPVKQIGDADIVGFTYWTRDTVYNLTEFVFIEDGDTLLIEPGTIIKGDPGLASDASALIAARDGLIYAVGGQECPVIFTSILDDIDNPHDIPLDTAFGVGRGLWGGLLLLGNACINAEGGEYAIEGIPPEELRGKYGGADDYDTSGVIRYVSIRHGGSEIGAANEINGLTMGGVGRGTRISHIEVFYNYDDGFEWFGGSVNCDHLIGAFCGDDVFDYDEGWRGAGQFWFAIHREDSGDRGGEHDGGNNPVDGLSWATPLISNATYVGRGAENGGQRCFEIRDNAGGAYFNSIFTDHGTYGIKVEYNATEDPATSRQRMQEGTFLMRNNIWWGFGNGNTAADICNNVAETQQHLFDNGYNTISDPGIKCISRTNDGMLNPRATTEYLLDCGFVWMDPKANYLMSPQGDCSDTICVDWPDFSPVTYAGAFDPLVTMEDSWASGWSFLYCGGFFGDEFCNVTCCLPPIRGNVDYDLGDAIDISDLVYLVDYMFTGGPEPPCFEEADMNGDSAIDISDLVYLVDFMFTGGPAPLDCPFMWKNN